MKPLVLGRDVDLSKFEVLMEIGRQERREELQSVLMIADRQGSVTGVNVCNELLPGRPEAVGRAILDRCQYLDLLDRKGSLTRNGEEALRTGMVFVPERGRYLIWLADDALLPQRLLHLQPVVESQVNDEVAMARRDGKQTQIPVIEMTEDLSSRLAGLEGGTFNLMGHGGGLVMIRKVDSIGVSKKLESSDSLRITLTILPSGVSRLKLEGKFERSLQAPEVNYEEAWVQALGPLAESWMGSRNPPALKVAFEGLSEGQLSSFSKKVDLPKPTLVRLGTFDDASVGDVPIIPKTMADAKQWAGWLLERSVNGYTDADRFEELRKSCEPKFPDFRNIELPSLEKLASKLSKERTDEGRLVPRYWYLQAPMDLQVAAK